MQPNDPILGSTVLRRPAIQSPNFIHLVSGWSINADGTAEFNGVTINGGQLILVDSGGNVVGTLDGSNGLVLYGNGGAGNPGMTLTPFGDLFWANFNASAIGGPRIEATNTGLQIEGGTNTGDTQAAALVVDTHLSANVSGVQVYPWLIGNNQSGGGSPVPAPESWNNVSFQHGWSNFGAPYDNVQYYCKPDRTVRLRGVSTSGTTADTTVMFQLPSGYVPPKQKFLTVTASNGTNPRVTIDTSGNVAIFGLSGASSVGFDGVTFDLG